jgi:hypothetical protein
MKVYKCNSCGKTIENPYKENMKEFCYSAEYSEYGVFPKPWKRKVKIHLCEDCFAGLNIIKESNENEA